MDDPALLTLIASRPACKSSALRIRSQSKGNKSPKGVSDSRNPSSCVVVNHFCEATFCSGPLVRAPDFETALECWGMIRGAYRGPAISMSYDLR